MIEQLVKHSTRQIVPILLTLGMVASLLGIATPAFADTSGARIAGAGADGGGSGSSWSNPGNITADDANFATSVLSTSSTSHYLNGTNYGFTVPGNAIINGIQVSIMRQSSSSALSNSINDEVVQLIKGGSQVGDDKGTSTDWPTSMGTATYGGVADLWGTTWTAAEINATNFGVALSGRNQSPYASRTASVDYMQITVTYTIPSPGGPSIAQTGADVSGVGTMAWSNPGYITGDDSNYATASGSNGFVTHYLRGTGYGFSVPAGATINGITVAINRASSNSNSPRIRDSEVKLVKAGAVQNAANRAATGTDWPANDAFATATYGGAADLWSTSWTAADINNANFGVVLSVTNTNSNSRTASVDYMQITVTYTPDATPPTVTGVTSSKTNGTYGAGQVIDVQVDFSEVVTVTGTPQLTLRPAALPQPQSTIPLVPVRAH